MNVGTLPDSVDTLVVGGGHAALTMSALLSERRLEHLLIERREALGGGWQDRWDDFRLVSPNWSASFPGYRYDGSDPDAFMTRDEIVDRVRRYADVIGAPVLLGTAVTRLAPSGDGGFGVSTNRGDIRARRVIVATGSFHTPRVPPFAGRLTPVVAHIHSHHYRNVGQLPPGTVLVVGSGQSGVQLAEELTEAGRRVILSVGTAGRTRRRYRGRDFFWWLAQVGQHGAKHGLGLPTVDKLPHPRARFAGNPHLSGHRGGHETNLRQFALDGMTLTGRLEDIDGTRVTFAPDLQENLARADRFFDERFRGLFDAYARRAALVLPQDDVVTVEYDPPEVTELDLAAEGVTAVLWSAGYRPDFGWIDAPILDEFGVPRHQRGVSDIPGLYFLGLHWQHTQGSATLFGPAVDGRHLLEHMATGTRG